MNMPKWLYIKKVDHNALRQMKKLLDGLGLHTICESGNCPNVGICFANRTATFLILGDVCSRNCAFCAVNKGNPLPLDVDEPYMVAQAAKKLNLEHIVVTSVTRDDLNDGGASWFALTIKEIKKLLPSSTVEVLVPDFMGSTTALKIVLEAKPDVLGHNVETIPRIYSLIRRKADYRRSLNILKEAKSINSSIITKSSIMVGLGEKIEEVFQVMEDLVLVNCDVITIGQYLSPSPAHVPVKEYVPLEKFLLYEQQAKEYGFKHVLSGPFVRSSFLAGNVFKD